TNGPTSGRVLGITTYSKPPMHLEGSVSRNHNPLNRWGSWSAYEQADADDGESVTETTWAGRRLVVAHNPERAAEQSTNRRRRIERVDELGERLARRLENQDAGKAGRGRRSTDRSAYQRFHKAVIEQRLSGIIKADLSAPEFHYDIDDNAWAAAERLDGKLLLVTSLNDREAREIVERYRSLADIERGFRALKSTLDIAPVHHRLPDRIRAHALLCFLALVVYRVLRMRLKANEALGLASVERLLEALETVQLHQVHLDGEAIQGISMDRVQRDLFKHLEVKPPHRDHVA
ncbi:IS1634 family transposase, partial [Aquisalimonas sp. APHAB1-3]|uniref:IS1634 family transposase n=1 Tax=Aquisalimonas sp. APHAB1-3 TaxID=3402080 RepID=UPI003AAA3362